MELRNVLRATRRRWWLIIVGLVGAFGCAGVATALAVPQYATSVTFFVATPSEFVSESYQGGMFSQQRGATYVHLINGGLARDIAAADGIDLTPKQVQERIKGHAIRDTVLLQATIVDSDPGRSQRIGQVLTERLISRVQQLETPPGKTTSTVKVDVLAGPTLDPSPVSPNPVRNFTLAGLFGMILGMAAAVVREQLDLTVKTAEALQQVAGRPVLGVVPLDSGAKRTPLVVGTRATEGAARGNRVRLACAEAFRHLRTNLQFIDIGRPQKVIVITSPMSEEGKSTVAANLAIAFAEAGRRVALVEADLRCPKVAKYLGLGGTVGLSNVLAGQAQLTDVLQRWGRLDLHLLPSGPTPPNPSELLSSPRMTALLQSLRETFDVVIIDTPPVVPFTDAAVVGAVADGAVLVVRSGKTQRARIRAAVASLRTVDARLLGCVLNMHARSVDDHYYYGHEEVAGEGEPVGANVGPATARHGTPVASGATRSQGSGR